MSITKTVILVTLMALREIVDIDCKNNLENHSFVNRVTTTSPKTTSTTSNWSLLLNNKNNINNNTNAYSHGPTYYYSPSSYGQTSKPSNNNYQYGVTSSTTTPNYSQQVSSPMAYYGIGSIKTKVTFPKDGTSTSTSSSSNSKRSGTSGSGTVYYKSNKDGSHDKDPSQDRNHYDNDEYDEHEDNYQQYRPYSYPYYATRKRIQHKISQAHSTKYNEEQDEDEKTDDYEPSRTSSSRDKPSYISSENPWRYGGSKYSGSNYYQDRHSGHSWQYPYEDQYEKMQAYHSSKDGGNYGGPLAFLLGLLPLGLLMAAMVPNVVPVAAAAAAAGAVGKRRRRGTQSDFVKPALIYPVLEAISKFGVTNLDDPKCLQRIFCTVTRDGRTSKSNIVQKAFYRIMAFMDESWMDQLGLKDLFRAVRRNECEKIKCKQLEKKNSTMSKVNPNTRIPKMRKRRNTKFNLS